MPRDAALVPRQQALDLRLSRGSWRRGVCALALATAALAVLAPAASAEISRAAAIAAVRALPAASSGDLAAPTVSFQATRSQEAWTVLARRPGSPRPLGSWTVDAQSGRVLGGGPLPAAPVYAKAEAESIARRDPKAAAWLDRFARTRASTTYKQDTRLYTVRFRSLDRPDAGTIAEVVVDGTTGEVRESWTGPQVAWKMARGYKDAFGRRLNRPALFLAFCVVFLLGLIDWRRPLALRNLDLVVLLSFAASLAFFNEGLIFWSVPLAYPPLLYLIARLGWIGARGPTQDAWTGRLPIWLLAGAAVFLLGFRGGLNAYDATVIDVGYAGVVGADRILRGVTPYDTIPIAGKPCGVRYADGSASAYRQPGGRCESVATGIDTYGPASYAAYVPAVAAFGWTGRWAAGGEGLPAAHVTTVIFDVLCALGLLLLGRRLRGWPLGVALSFAWLAFPFTAYAMQSNTNDPILAAGLIWAMVAALSPFARGALLGLAAAVKFAPLLLIPLAARYPRRRQIPVAEWEFDELMAPAAAPARAGDGRRRRLVRDALPIGMLLRYGAGLLVAVALAAVVIAPGGFDGLGTFYESTFTNQLERESPFSLWQWHMPKHLPGFPDLSNLQSLLRFATIAVAALVALLPLRLDMVRLAAIAGALMGGFQLVLTHWSYLYLPWLFAFAIVALCAPSHVE